MDTAEGQPEVLDDVSLDADAAVDQAGEALEAAAISDSPMAAEITAMQDEEAGNGPSNSAQQSNVDDGYGVGTSDGAAAAAPPAEPRTEPAAGAANGAEAVTTTSDAQNGTAAALTAPPDSGSAKDAAAVPPTVDNAGPSDAQQQSRPVPYGFTGLQCLLDHAKAEVRALSFGRLDSELLAFGDASGTVRIARINEQRASILHQMAEHKKRVTDLDWSLENQQLLSASEDGSVCLSASDNDIWSMTRRLEMPTAATTVRFHPVNQNLIVVGQASGAVDVYNLSTGMVQEDCRAQLTSSQADGVGAATMDTGRDVLFVGDTSGYIHALRFELKGGALLPLTLLTRIPPPGNRLASLASLSFTAWASSISSPALLASGTDDLVSVYKISSTGSKLKLELSSKHLMPQSARPLQAAWCPTLPSAEPLYVAMGGENTAVNVYDISDPVVPPVPVVALQGHRAPVVSVAWSFDERRLASSDCDGVVICWKRAHAETTESDTPY